MKTEIENDTLFREIEKISGERFFTIGPVKGRLLADIVRNSGVKMVLEIGTYIGYSAILMAKALPEDGKVVTIEIDPKSVAQALCNIQKTKCINKIEIRVGDAGIVIPGIREEFDVIFIDADKSRYLEYLKLSEKKLKRGGIVFTDNVKVFASDMPDFLDYVRKSGRYESRYIDMGYDGVEISKKLF